tara:strand:+ start:438 stop:2075 length:1638 start_codon:yes stop_codon:yes gene_type:complete
MSITTYHPTFGQNSRTGELMSSPGPIWRTNMTYPCKKCIYHGESTLFKTIKPCTICAMDNGGKWGWDDNVLGEENLIDENGALPGHCGVEDCLVRNEIGGYYTSDVSKTLNEQIVLGFAQYALYNHLKWKEILVPSERSVYYPSLNEYRNRYAADDTSNIDEDGQIDQAWYWWKMIPRGLCLPERLISTFRQMIVSFEDKQHEGCVPKTSQKLEGVLSDDIWTDFDETYVEPVQVAHLFHMTMLKLLECDDEVEFDSVSLDGDDALPQDIGAVDKKWIRETASHLGDDIQGLKYIYYKKINYEVAEDDPGRTKTKVVKIFDKDIFGTYLEDVTDYDWCMRRPWYRRTDIWHPVPNIIEANGEDRRGHHWEKELWNPGLRCSILAHLKDEVYEYIAYGATGFWEDIMRTTNEMLESDYENERSFNEYISNTDPSELDGYHSVTYVVNDEDDWPPSIWMDDLDEWRPHSVARQLDFGNEEIDYDSEIEYEPGEIEVNNNSNSTKLSEVVEKLKDLQMFVDDSVKDSVPEGVYLELVNKMLDVYKCAK